MNKQLNLGIEKEIDMIQSKPQLEEYVITLDIGKFETKAIGRNIQGTAEDIKRVSFRTKMYNLADGDLEAEGNSYRIDFNEQSIIIGEQGETKSNETSKTNLLHQLSAYVAISKFLKPDTNNKINLVLACPISVLKIAEAKEEYKNFIKGNGQINIKVNSKSFSFFIENVTIKAEGSGIVFTEPELFTNKNVAVVDFGGLNMGFSLYRNGVCKQNDRFVEEFGANELTLKVKDALTTLKKGNVVKYDEAEQALEKGYMSDFSSAIPESIPKIKEVKEKFLEAAVDILKTNSYKLEQFDSIVFVGGTTQKLKEQITNKYPNASIPINSQWSTAEGLYKVACAKYCK